MEAHFDTIPCQASPHFALISVLGQASVSPAVLPNRYNITASGKTPSTA